MCVILLLSIFYVVQSGHCISMTFTATMNACAAGCPAIGGLLFVTIVY